MEDDVSKVANEPREEEGEAASEEAPLPRKSALKKVRDREGGSSKLVKVLAKKR